MEAKDKPGRLWLHKQIVDHKPLIIDGSGFVQVSKTRAELLFNLISQRDQCGAVLITRYLPFDE